ncbi:MAG TPA: hypothetical protein VGW76_13780 [Pyrinomonadaceae bacterium]|nr:hypothetical protein [Pyrinomonadaceae bacterium]
MKRERDPTPEEFEKLLAWLAFGGRDYQTTHHRLTRIFISRGCTDAETLADEVMNRVGVRIVELVKKYEGDPIRCLLGFADNVYFEYSRDQQKQAEVEPASQITPPDENEEKEREYQNREVRYNCLTQCMRELSIADRSLFQRYVEAEKRARIDGRKRLAAELRMTANALRIKAHRLRGKLRRCMETCVDEALVSETIPHGNA